jgi:hypothetical protein
MNEDPEMFLCPNHLGQLMVTARFCGQSWKRAAASKEVEDRVRLGPCMGCALGQQHAAGVPSIVPVLPASRRYTISPRAIPADVPLPKEPKKRARRR